MPLPLRVLILEDRPADAELMLHELRQTGFELDWQCVETEAEYVTVLRRCTQTHETLDVILADYSLPQFDALRALHLLREYGPDIPFIVYHEAQGHSRTLMSSLCYAATTGRHGFGASQHRNIA